MRILFHPNDMRLSLAAIAFDHIQLASSYQVQLVVVVGENLEVRRHLPERCRTSTRHLPQLREPVLVEHHRPLRQATTRD